MLAPAKLEDGQTARIGSQQVRYVRRSAAGAPAGDLPIVVLHGWGAHIEAVAPILAALDGAPDLIALDLPGFGESEPPPEAWDVDAYMRFLVDFLEELGVERAHLVGHSHGGRVSIALAAAHPERVGRLLLDRLRRPPAEARLALPAPRGGGEARPGGGQGRRPAGTAASGPHAPPCGVA